MPDPGPTRTGSDLADVVEMLLDKGVVVNADIAVTVGETELLGVHVKAAIASFETAAKYGLQFPEGTDEERLYRAAGIPPDERPSSEDDESAETDQEADRSRSPADPESPDKLAVRPHATPTGETAATGTRGAVEGAAEGVREAVEGTREEDEEPPETEEPEADGSEAEGSEADGSEAEGSGTDRPEADEPEADEPDETEGGDDED